MALKRARFKALLTRGPQATVLPRRMAALREMPITRALKECDCRAKHAFHEWRSQTLTPAFNYGINFTIPANRRLVIELVTASISVPIGELARLRMFTGLGQSPSNLDFVLTPQGISGGQQNLVGTHCVRAYADSLLAFNINRDNALTTGSALICVSGYLEPL